MRDQVPVIQKLIVNETSFNNIGLILDKTWKLKKQISKKISNPIIDEMYQKALDSGALGGKISGAGGGGFLLLYVPRENQNSVRKALENYREFPFMLEPDGSKIIFNIKRDYWK
jgi:D-glycero-alpha-D-manno-heptose-7-phosphate kinase